MIEPIGDLVLVFRDEAPGTTPGGLIIPDTAKTKPNRGVVESVGPGRLKETGGRVPMTVVVGDEVIYQPSSGFEIRVEGKHAVILREEDILAVVE